MIKIGTFLWIILTIVLIGFPVLIIAFFLSKKVQKVLGRFYDKFKQVHVLKRFKEDILFKSKKAQPHKEETEDIDAPKIMDVSDSFPEVASPINEPVIVEEKIDIIQNIVDASDIDSPVPQQEDIIFDKESFLKNKKLMEKIVYEALVLRKEGKLDDYEKKLIEWLALDPNDKDLNRFLADYYFSLGNHKKSLSLLKKIVELDPKDHKAIWQIGEIYLTSWDFETAELLIEKAITINPANPKYYVSMVELYYNTDRKHDAIQQLEQIVRLRPTNPSYMLTLADLYSEIDDLDNAQKYYFRVLEHEPSNEKAKKKLKDLVKE